MTVSVTQLVKASIILDQLIADYSNNEVSDSIPSMGLVFLRFETLQSNIVKKSTLITNYLSVDVI